MVGGSSVQIATPIIAKFSLLMVLVWCLQCKTHKPVRPGVSNIALFRNSLIQFGDPEFVRFAFKSILEGQRWVAMPG